MGIILENEKKKKNQKKYKKKHKKKKKKNMFFVIPEMPSKTFVMVLKKLSDHFNGCQLGG